RADQDRPDPPAEHRGDRPAALRPDPGAPGHPAGGDAGAGDHGRHRRPAQGRLPGRTGDREPGPSGAGLQRQAGRPTAGRRAATGRPGPGHRAGLGNRGHRLRGPTGRPDPGRSRTGRVAGAGAATARAEPDGPGRAVRTGRTTERPRLAPGMSPRARPAAFDVDGLLKDPELRVIVTCGSGGVGKTTTAAALGLRAAEQCRRVVVLTIDPARRLAQSLCRVELDNTPRAVTGIEGDGALLAMMLDMKRTFDEVVLAN